MPSARLNAMVVNFMAAILVGQRYVGVIDAGEKGWTKVDVVCDAQRTGAFAWAFYKCSPRCPHSLKDSCDSRSGFGVGAVDVDFPESSQAARETVVGTTMFSTIQKTSCV